MTKLELDELFHGLVECAGEGDTALTADAADTPFDDLGYDSLALMELAAWIKKRTGVAIPDEQVADVSTPRELLDLINVPAMGVR